MDFIGSCCPYFVSSRHFVNNFLALHLQQHDVLWPVCSRHCHRRYSSELVIEKS